MFARWTLLSLIAAGAAVMLHLLLFGRRRPPESTAPAKTVRRFSRRERVIHWAVLLGFLVVAVTGFDAVLCRGELTGYMLWLHFAGGGLFLVALTVMVLRWAEDNRFGPADWQWIRRVGGYFSFRRGGPRPPAGRFDAGQKIFFWLSSTLGLICVGTILLSMTPWFGTAGQRMLIRLHRISALLLTLAVIAHGYVSLVIKSRAWRSLTRGNVDFQWAKHYHPLWTEEISQESNRHERQNISGG